MRSRTLAAGWARVTAAAVLALAPAPRAQAEITDAPWLRLALGREPIPIGDLQIGPERERELVESGAGFTDLLFRYRGHLRADGIREESAVQVRRFLSDEGAASGGDLDLWAMPSFEEVVLEAAYLLQPNGSRVDIDPRALQSLPSPIPRVFSDARRIVVPFRGVTRGSTAVLAYRSTFRARDWPLPIASRFSLQLQNPAERIAVELTWDPSLAAPVWASNDPGLECRTEPRKLSCTKVRVAAVHPDPDLRSYYDEIPELVIADPTSWEQVAKRARDVVEAKIREPLPAGALERIAGSSGTADERWQKLFDFVANEVRYLGLEHGSSSVVPRPPAATLESRYGDCKDKVSLLVALARAAGIDAYAALVSTERFDPSRITTPGSSYFNHMIACRAHPDGRRECVDPTIAGAAAAETAMPIGGAVMLELRDGTRALSQVDRAEFGSEIGIDGEIRYECDGSQRSRITRSMRGVAGIAYRQALQKLSTSERTRVIADEYQQLVTQGVPPSIEIRGLADPHAPLAISVETRTPPSRPLREHPMVQDADYWTMFHGVSMRSQNRHFSYLNQGARISSSLRYEVCASLRPVFSGAELDLSSRYGKFQRRYAVEPSAVVVTSTFAVPSRGVPAGEIADFNRFLETSLDQADVWFKLSER